MKHKLKKVLKWTAITVSGFAAIAYSVVAVSVFIAVANQDGVDQATLQSECKLHAGKLLDYVNEERAKLGAPQLASDPVLASGAKYKLDHMVEYKYFSHEMPNGEDWAKKLRDSGISAAVAENIGSNDLTPEQSWAEFKGSPSHYSSLVDPLYTRIGISTRCTDYTIEMAAIESDNQYVGDKVTDLTVIMLAGDEPGRPQNPQPAVNPVTCTHYELSGYIPDRTICN